MKLIYGPMFSGKTEKLIKLAREATATGRDVRCFKHASDTRYHEFYISTHDGDKIVSSPVHTAGELYDAAYGAEYLFVDEIQFFKPSVVPVLQALEDMGTDITVAGLMHKFDGTQFRTTEKIWEKATHADIMMAVCATCDQPAMYTQRLTPIKNNNWVGGVADWSPRCENHFTPLLIGE